MGRGVAIGVTVGEREDADGPGSHGHQQHPLRRPHAPATPALPQRACQVKLVKLHTVTIFLDSIKKKRTPGPKALWRREERIPARLSAWAR